MRSLLALALASLLPLLACSGAGGGGESCETSANCPARARCLDALCVADAAPVARVQGLAHAVDRALATFDGSASADVDGDDAVVEWRWSLRPVDAACEAPPPPPSSPVVHVRFPCAGRWEVALVAVDTLGAESAAALHPVDVSAYSGPARVTAGDDRSVAHACAGEPLRCVPVDAEGAAVELGLAAALAASDADAPTVAFAWTATPPPGLALTAARRVEFVPGPDAPSPTVRLETDGVAIAGQWVFRVEVRDRGGVIGVADQLVTVENRPPVVVATVPATVPHRYDASRRFIASGEIPISVADPDGDPITRRPPLGRHLGDGPGDTFEVGDAGTALTYWAEVRYETPADAAHLVGPDVTREIELVVDDVNGGSATALVPVVVGNRPPRRVNTVPSVSVGHQYDAATATYRAQAQLARYVDDDGDPLVQDAPTGDGMCATIVVDAGGHSTVHCALPFQGSPAVSQFAVSHLVLQRVRDPWAQVVEADASATVTITNRSPAVSAPNASVPVTCATDHTMCCEPSPDGCIVPLRTRTAGTGALVPVATDPDGDPLEVQVASCGHPAPTSRVCLAGDCGAFPVTSCAVDSCEPASGPDVTVQASDGALTATANPWLNETCGG